MAPPPYGDLGKQARGIFSNGYHFGLIKLDVSTTSASGVGFSTGGVSNQLTGKVSGSLQTNYKIKEHGISFSEKWSTDNTLSTSISVANKGVNGLTVGTDLNFSPNTGLQMEFAYDVYDDFLKRDAPKAYVPEKWNARITPFLKINNSGDKSGKIKTSFQNDRVAVNFDSDLSSQPVIGASIVVAHQAWLAGYQTAFRTEDSTLTKNNFALGYSTGDFILHTNVDHSDNGQEFGGSIYQKLSPKLETGIMLAWSAGSNDTKFGIGAKYELDRDASVRAKVNNQSQIGLGYQQKLRDGITLTLSALIDGQNFNSGGHQVGLALEMTA